MSVNTKVNGQLVPSAGLYSVTKPIGMADIYSTEEKEVGLWVDNRPLYQKTYVFGADVTVSHDTFTNLTAFTIPTNIDYIRNAECFRIGNKGLLSIDCALVASGGSTYIAIRNSSAYDVTVASGSTLTITYTKTTDTPWSGKFVPQGYGYVSSGDIYSEQERQIGVWTDGKPLYQKTVHITALPSSAFTATNYAHNISNIDKICDWEGTATTSDGSSTAKFNVPQFNSSGFVKESSFVANVTKTNIAITVGADRSTWSSDFTIQYTKTTDVAGSGEYVPSGDKAVHYDDTEQVIGTWTDGSTLYERTVRVPANTTGQNIVTLWNDTNIQVREYNGCFVFRASENTASLCCRPTDNSYKLVVYTIGCSEQYGVYAEIDLGTQRGNAVDLMLTLKYIKVTS